MIAALRVASTLALATALAVTAASTASAAEVYSVDGGPPAASAQRAADSFERALPGVATIDGYDLLEGQRVAPFLTSVGDHLSTVGAMGAPTIAKDAARGFELDTRHGALRVAPTWVSSAPAEAGVAGDSAAVFPAVVAGIDLLVRPTAVGIASYVGVADQLAAKDLSWTVALARGAKLRELSDGGIAVVTEPQGDRGATGARERRAKVAAPDPRAQYDDARARNGGARAEAKGEVVAVIHPPQAHDAAGGALPARLDAHGDSFTLRLEHRRAIAYPVVAAVTASYADAWERTWEEADTTGTVQPAADGLVKALLPDGRIVLTHGPDTLSSQHPESLPEDDDDEFEQRGEEGKKRDAPAGSPGSMPHVCVPDNERRLTLVYAGPDGAQGLTDAVKRRIRRDFAAMNSRLYGEALDSGGDAHPARFRADCDSAGRATILPIETDSNQFEPVIAAALDQDVDDPDSKYLVFNENGTGEDGPCGEGDFLKDETLSTRNKSNGLSSLDVEVEGGWAILYGRECWWSENGLHEVGHTMGAVQPGAPGSNGEDVDGDPLAHCWDGYDVMCYLEYRDEDQTIAAPYSSDECTVGPRGTRFDCDYNSYFDTNPEAGSWLNEHWNLGSRKNQFLDFARPPADVANEPFVYYGSDSQDFSGLLVASDGPNAPKEPGVLLNGLACDGCTSADSPALSPNGRQVAFTSQRSEIGCVELYTMRIDGTGRRRIWDCLDHQGVGVGAPQYAAANGRLLFEHHAVDEENSSSDIYSMRTDGTDLTRVIHWPAQQGYPTMNGSGTQLAFTSYAKPDGTPIGGFDNALFVTGPHGEHPVQMTAPDLNFVSAEYPRFSHDGNWLAFEGRRPGEEFPHVYAVRVDGTGLRTISTGAGGVTPEWTPTGYIVYGQVDSIDFTGSRLVKVDPDDMSRAKIYSPAGLAYDAAFRTPSYRVDGFEPPEAAPLPALP
jgi:hypothetical protein